MLIVKQIQDILEAKVYCCPDLMEAEVHTACGSDMMSDVLAFAKDQGALLTGLNNPQVVRTAEMMDMICIIFVRGKTPTPEVVALAQERGIIVLSTPYRMFSACGRLYAAGLQEGGGN